MAYQTTENSGEQRWTKLRATFVGPDYGAEFLKAPFDRESMARAGWERAAINPEWLKEKDRVQLLLSQCLEKIFDAFRKRQQEYGEICENTEQELQALSDQCRSTFSALGERARVQETPYSKNPEKDTMEMSELLTFNGLLQDMLKLNPEELLDMVQEDQQYIQLLKKKTDEAFAEHDIEHIALLILGKEKTVENKEKSDFRKQAEAFLWQELVRSMSFEEKRSLIKEAFRIGGEEGSRNLISRCFLREAMNRRELQHMYAEQDSVLQNLGDEKQFDQFLTDLRDIKENREKEMKQYVSEREVKNIDNAAAYFFTFNKIGAETIGRIGALTALTNFALRVSERIKTRSPGEGRLIAAFKGAGDALTDKFVLGGAAVAAWSSNEIYPWWNKFVTSPSEDEKNRLANYHGVRFLREQNDNHEEIMDYFVEHYDDLYAMAKAKKGEKIKIGEKKHERGLDIYQGDLTDEKTHAVLKITPEKAGQMGYENVEMAEVAIIKMFAITSRIEDGKLKDQAKLEKFLNEQKIAF